MDEHKESELPRWLWLWAPLVPAVALVVSFYAAPGMHRTWFYDKEGPLEWGTAIVLVPAVIAGVVTLLNHRVLPGRLLRYWIGLVTLGAFYFAGEEVSWGQWIWHWESPEFFAERNEQAETNIHNMSSWFNEKPRLAIKLWILAGAIMTIRRLRAPDSPRWKSTGWRAWFWPTRVALPTSILALAIYLPRRFEKVFFEFERGTLLAELRLSEPQEFYIAFFLMLYLLSLAMRSRLAVAAAEVPRFRGTESSPAFGNPAQSAHAMESRESPESRHG